MNWEKEELLSTSTAYTPFFAIILDLQFCPDSFFSYNSTKLIVVNTVGFSS